MKTPAKKTKSSKGSKVATKALKTTPNDGSTRAFLQGLDASKRADCERIDGWMRGATGAVGVMYGKAIVGYGTSTIRYADGREAPWMKMGFAPRKQALVLYGVLGGASPEHLARLGKHTKGKGCLYIKRLADIDAEVLAAIIRAATRA